MQVTGPSESSVQQQQPDEQSQQHETATDEASFTVLPCQNPLNEDDTAGEESTPSRSSSSSSYIDFSFSCYSDIESDPEDDRSFIEAMGAWNNMETQKTHNEDALESDLPTDESEYPSWESLPRPAFDRVFSYLRTDKKCSDLASLAKVSTLFRAEVKKFMRTPNNRPGLKSVDMLKTANGMKIKIQFFPTNIPFYDLNKVDWGRFKRSRFLGKRYFSIYLEVTLKDSEDPAVEQVTALLSTTIQSVVISNDYGCDDIISTEDLSMCDPLLCASTPVFLVIRRPQLDDVTAPTIISMATRADKIHLNLVKPQQLTDPGAAFIAQLDSLSLSFVNLGDNGYRPFFGLPKSFWTTFLNEKLRSNSVNYVQVEWYDKVTKAPIQLPDEMWKLMWENAKAK